MLRLWVAVVLLVGALPAVEASALEPGRWGADVGFVAAGVEGTSGADLELALGGFADQTLTPEGARARVRLMIKGRARLNFLPSPTLRAARLTTLGVQIDAGALRLLVGRHVIGGRGWRVTDGIQATGLIARGFRVGGWVGLLADPFTTLPSPDRLGAGPLLTFERRRFRVSVAGEVVVALGGAAPPAAGPGAGPGGPGGPAGPGGTALGRPLLDRTGIQVDVSGEPHADLRLAGRIDIQGRLGGPVGIADGGFFATWRFRPTWDLRGGVSVYSSLAQLATAGRDEALVAFVERRSAALGQDLQPVDVLDRQHHLAVELRLRRRAGGDVLRQLRGELRARYRHALAAEDRWLRVGLTGGGVGLAGGAVDLQGDAAFYWSGGRPRFGGGPRVYASPLPGWTVDGAVSALADLSGAVDPEHMALVEVWTGIRVVKELFLSVGYELLAGREGAPSHVTVRHQGVVRMAVRR